MLACAKLRLGQQILEDAARSNAGRHVKVLGDVPLTKPLADAQQCHTKMGCVWWVEHKLPPAGNLMNEVCQAYVVHCKVKLCLHMESLCLLKGRVTDREHRQRTQTETQRQNTETATETDREKERDRDQE